MHPSTAETISLGDMTIRFRVDAENSGGSVSVFECDVRAHARMPAPHSHDGFEETIYGLRGVTVWTVDGETVELTPGDVICIPRGAVHGFANAGDVDATFLAIASPGVFGPDYFREIGAVMRAAAGGPPDVAAMGEVMRRHGLTPAVPVQS